MQEAETKEVPFELRLPLGDIVAYTGVAVLLYGLISFFANQGDSDVLQVVAFVYGIPASVGGLALKYAELPPVPLDTSPQAETLRESKANPTLQKIISDTTRYTYGDLHLEKTLIALKLSSSFGPPALSNLSESVTESGEYKFTMRFKSENVGFPVWKKNAFRFPGFFGPGVRSELSKYDSAKRLIEVSLITLAPGEEPSSKELLADGTLAPIEKVF
jgi:hypothetical protein